MASATLYLISSPENTIPVDQDLETAPSAAAPAPVNADVGWIDNLEPGFFDLGFLDADDEVEVPPPLEQVVRENAPRATVSVPVSEEGSSSSSVEKAVAAEKVSARLRVARQKKKEVKRAKEVVRKKRKTAKKGIPWSEPEHRRFLEGLVVHGKGDWRSIAYRFVRTRTPIQVASHAQKFMDRLEGKRQKSRPSINDITTVDGPSPWKVPRLNNCDVLAPEKNDSDIAATDDDGENGKKRVACEKAPPTPAAMAVSAPTTTYKNTNIYAAVFSILTAKYNQRDADDKGPSAAAADASFFAPTTTNSNNFNHNYAAYQGPSPSPPPAFSSRTTTTITTTTNNYYHAVYQGPSPPPGARCAPNTITTTNKGNNNYYAPYQGPSPPPPPAFSAPTTTTNNNYYHAYYEGLSPQSAPFSALTAITTTTTNNNYYAAYQGRSPPPQAAIFSSPTTTTTITNNNDNYYFAAYQVPPPPPPQAATFCAPITITTPTNSNNNNNNYCAAYRGLSPPPPPEAFSARIIATIIDDINSYVSYEAFPPPQPMNMNDAAAAGGDQASDPVFQFPTMDVNDMDDFDFLLLDSDLEDIIQ